MTEYRGTRGSDAPDVATGPARARRGRGRRAGRALVSRGVVRCGAFRAICISEVPIKKCRRQCMLYVVNLVREAAAVLCVWFGQ